MCREIRMRLKLRTRLSIALSPIRDRIYDRSLRKWLDEIDTTGTPPTSKTYVFNTTRSDRRNFHLMSDFFLARILAKNGGCVYVLLDDGVLQHWDTVQLRRLKSRRLTVMRSGYLRSYLMHELERLWQVFALPKMHLLWYSTIVPGCVNEALTDEDVDFARASTIRYFEAGVLDLSDSRQDAYYRLSLENAKVSRAIGRYVVEQLKPDVFATSHGIYSTWGPAYAYVRQNGIPTRVYSRHPYRLGGLLIRDEAGMSFDRDELERFMDDADFNDSARQIAQDYVDARFSHRISDTKEYFKNITSAPESGLNKYQSDDYEVTFGLFPNVVWDAVGKQNFGLYDNVIDWVVDTVRVIGANRKYRLIIRYHPSESTRMRGSLPSHEIIRNALPEIESYKNVTLIHSDEPVNSYDLLRSTVDIALIYTSTFGAEAQLLGVPVVAAASGRFSERTVHRVRSLPEYYTALNHPQAAIKHFQDNQDAIVRNVLKYHYYMNQESFCPVGIMGQLNPMRIAFRSELRNGSLLDQRSMCKTLLKLDGLDAGFSRNDLHRHA